jgi:hypothetical protein
MKEKEKFRDWWDTYMDKAYGGDLTEGRHHHEIECAFYAGALAMDRMLTSATKRPPWEAVTQAASVIREVTDTARELAAKCRN